MSYCWIRFWVIVFFGLSFIGLEAEESKALWGEFKANPDNHPLIPNNAYAGYMRGEQLIPEVRAVVDVRSFGGRGDGQTFNDDAIRQAIEAAWEAGGGAVQFPAGEFLLEGLILLHREGVVLRGEGPGQTVFRFEQPLVEVLGRTGGDVEQWNWTGGLLWIGPGDFFRWKESENGQQRWVWEGLGQSPMDFRERREEPFRSSWENWQTIGEEGVLARVEGYYPRGTRKVGVDDAATLEAGDLVIMTWENPLGDALWLEIAGHDLFAGGDWFEGWMQAGVPQWTWPVEILAVEGRSVTLAQPTRVSIRPEFKVTMRQPGANETHPPSFITQAGVENLTMQMENQRPAYGYNQGVGWNGIFFNRAIHCWARNVEILQAETAVNVSSSKNVTVTGIEVFSPYQSKYITTNRVMSHDILYENIRVGNTATVSNGINTEWLSSGNVWSRIEMDKGTFDSHRMMAFDGIRTEIRLRNPADARPGGNRAAGPFIGRRMVHWNIEVSDSDRAEGERGMWVLDPEQYVWTAQVGMRGAPVMQREDHFGMPPGDKEVRVREVGSVPEPANLFAAQRVLRFGEAAGETAVELPEAFRRPPHRPGTAYAFFTVTPESGRPPLTVQLDAGLSRGCGSELVALRWDFGDTQRRESLSPAQEHTFTEEGTYTISLEVETREGQRDVHIFPVTVGNSPPEAVVQVSDTVGTPPLTVDFDARESTSAYGEIVRFDWSFGDGAQALDGEVKETHTYSQLGHYTAHVSVTDDLGESSNIVEIPIRVSQEPELFARINFQPPFLPAPEGWIAAGREVFGERDDGLRFGWQPRAGAPRQRNSDHSPDFIYDSFVHSNGAVWEMEVPKGEYEVLLVAGDATNLDSVYRVKVQDVLVLDGRPTPEAPWVEGRARVQVEDGRLSVRDAPGALNVKLAWIEILRVPED
ncbi:MAG: PKD domain-containing protein [Opitutales bacterium]|nr:PKD domain-containing protein [Opitutales bacterium]